MQNVACMEKCGNSQSSNSCIRIVNMHNDACPKKCCKSRSNSSVRFSDIDTIKIHKKACLEKCGDYKTSGRCKCPKIKIKKMHSKTCMEKCGDSQSSSIKCRKIKSDKMEAEASREKCGDSQTNNDSSGTSLSVCMKISFTSDTTDEKSTKSKSSNSRTSNSRSSNSRTSNCKSSKSKSSKSKSSKSKSSNSKSLLSKSSNSSTDIECFQETFQSKVTYLPNQIKTVGKDTTENQCSHVSSNANETLGYKLDHSFWYRCPQCRREITYCPYDIDENCCFKCPKCCKDIKYFDAPCNMEVNPANTNAKSKSCNKKRKLKNIEEYKKKKIYHEFIEFCREKCYHPEMLECILLSNACIQAQNNGHKDLEEHCGSSEGVPFSKQMPPHTDYCMYGSKLDDWFTHYLIRYLSRAESEKDCKATAWLNKLYKIIEEKYMLEDKEERLKRLARNRMMRRLSKLYNSTVGPTPSEANFYNQQKYIDQNYHNNQARVDQRSAVVAHGKEYERNIQ